MATLDQIALALQGFDAGVQGRGLEFAQGLKNEEIRKRDEQRRLSIERRNAMVLDNRVSLDHLTKGRTGAALDVLNNRLSILNQIGADPSDTILQRDLIKAGKIDEAIENARIFDDAAVVRGLIDPIPAPQRKLIKAEEGRATFLNPDGTVSEEAIRGAIQDAGDKLKITDVRNINKDVTDLTKEPLKIKNAASRLEKISKTKSPTDQLAAIFTFMKALDPTSVVREGEQEQARATGGITDQFIGVIQRIQGEGALPPAVFDNMVMTAKRIANQAVSDSRSEVMGYLDGFGEKLPEKAKTRFIARVPTLFDITEVSPQIQPVRSQDDFSGFRVLGVE